MKKLFLLIAVLTVVVTVHAQISGGLKAGLNLTTFGSDAGDFGEDVKLKPGFNIGGYINVLLNEKLSFQPELLISTAGAKIDVKGQGYSQKSTDKLLYLSIPLSLQYSPGNFNIHAGPQLSFLMSAKSEFTATGRDINNNPITMSGEENTLKNFKRADLGLNFGIGHNFGKLSVNVRYSLSITNVLDSEEILFLGYKWTNNVMQVSAMYKLFGK